MSVEDWVTVQIYVGDYEVTQHVVFSQTRFQAVASANPGTCQIVIRDYPGGGNWQLGCGISLKIDGDIMWQGYLFTLEQGYAFEADNSVRRWTLSGVDLNILFDKLIMYNHAHPTWSLDGGGHYAREATDGGWVVAVPQETSDQWYIKVMLQDCDINLVQPAIKIGGYWENGTFHPDADCRIREFALINPDGKFTPPTPGQPLRAFMEDVSANVARSTPGSVVWYISPDAYLVWEEQDSNYVSFSVGDDAVGTDVMVKNLRITTDISAIKNDVLLFTGNLNPTPESPQEHILFKHNSLTVSVNEYGRFQWSETLGSDWLQGAINVRSTKILYQEAVPSTRAEFTLYKQRLDENDDHGLFPGRLISINSAAHTFKVWDAGLTELVDTHTISLPIRSLDMSFPTVRDDGKVIVEYRVQCSVNTQDPWGLLLALKRPPPRGLTPPSFETINRNRGDTSTPRHAETYVRVTEFPKALSGHRWQCSYAYIRYSLTVFVDGLRRISLPEGATTVGFIETDPDNGIFYMDETADEVHVEYHVWHDLTTQ